MQWTYPAVLSFQLFSWWSSWLQSAEGNLYFLEALSFESSSLAQKQECSPSSHWPQRPFRNPVPQWFQVCWAVCSVVYDTQLAVVRGFHSFIPTSAILGLDRCDDCLTLKWLISKVLISYSSAFQGTVEERDHLMTLDLICILLCDSQAYSLIFPAFCGLIRPWAVSVHASQSVQCPESSWKSW